MIQGGTPEWKSFLKLLQKSKKKSNRDVLCLDCWEIFSYERNIRHKRENPTHLPNILTSNQFATESRFIKIAKLKDRVKLDGQLALFENPFKNFEKRLMTLNVAKKKLIKEMKVGDEVLVPPLPQPLPEPRSNSNINKVSDKEEMKSQLSDMQENLVSMNKTIEKLKSSVDQMLNIQQGQVALLTQLAQSIPSQNIQRE